MTFFRAARQVRGVLRHLDVVPADAVKGSRQRGAIDVDEIDDRAVPAHRLERRPQPEPLRDRAGQLGSTQPRHGPDR